MTKFILAAGVAALALAGPALSERGNGNKGGGKGDKAANVDRGGGKQDRADKRGGGDMKIERADRGDRGDKLRIRGDDDRKAMRGGGNDGVRNAGKADRIDARGRDDRDVRIVDRDDRDVRIVDRDRDRDGYDGRRLVRFEDNDRGYRGLVNGCPPGLARKDNGCMPPGQFKKIGSALPAAFASRLLDGPYRQWYRDDAQYLYRNDGDYIYRVNRDGGLIDALFPFADRDFSYYPVGMNYPSQFNQYNVPYQYRSFYPDGGDYNYRYGDGAIYQVDPSTSAIQSIVALLAGDLGVGQRMPANYGAYNVPLDYRDRYYDTPDAMYRYNDGYIYRADPKTQLITAVIDALV